MSQKLNSCSDRDGSTNRLSVGAARDERQTQANSSYVKIKETDDGAEEDLVMIENDEFHHGGNLTSRNRLSSSVRNSLFTKPHLQSMTHLEIKEESEFLETRSNQVTEMKNHQKYPYQRNNTTRLRSAVAGGRNKKIKMKY